MILMVKIQSSYTVYITLHHVLLGKELQVTVQDKVSAVLYVKEFQYIKYI